MFDQLRTVLLRVSRVPPEPAPPFGAPGSVRVFRASGNYYKLRLLGWGIGQIGALAGIVFSLWFFHQVERTTETAQRHAAQATNTPPASVAATNAGPVAEPRQPVGRGRERWKQPAEERFRKLVANWPKWIFPLLTLLEIGALGFYFVQVLVTYAALRLDFELRWYVVTDRSLRIRSGVWSVREITMSFANLQQVMVSQGPLQRWLNIADLRVESAGGGASMDPHGGHPDSMHAGVFHGVENATEVRDLILARLQSFRETGLGDPDEAPSAPPPPGDAPQPDALVAARELLAETRALRAALSARS